MFSTNQSRSYVSIKSGHKDFTFSPDGIVLVPRASLEISGHCSQDIKNKIDFAIAQGWLHLVAHMRDTEYTMELLRK
jgi:hypothetical protein